MQNAYRGVEYETYEDVQLNEWNDEDLNENTVYITEFFDVPGNTKTPNLCETSSGMGYIASPHLGLQTPNVENCDFNTPRYQRNCSRGLSWTLNGNLSEQGLKNVGSPSPNQTYSYPTYEAEKETKQPNTVPYSRKLASRSMSTFSLSP